MPRFTAYLALLLTLTPALTLAQTAGNTPPVYQVELVLFELTDPNAFYAEQWPQDLPDPDITGAVELSMSKSATGFVLLGGNQEFGPILEKLTKSTRYNVIKHMSWRQPGLPPEQAVPVRIHGGEDYTDRYPQRSQSQWSYDERGMPLESPPKRLEQVDGWIRIALGRYLHVYTDLVLRKPVILQRFDETQGKLVEEGGVYDIHVREQRRMRSRELHYLDHPMLGTLIKITPVEK